MLQAKRIKTGSRKLIWSFKLKIAYKKSIKQNSYKVVNSLVIKKFIDWFYKYKFKLKKIVSFK